MADLLLLIGVCLVFWSIWYHKKKKVNEVEELGRLQKELVQAKNDVNLLMKELAGVSEQVVDNITEKIKTAQETINKLDRTTTENYHNPSNPQKVISITENRQKDREIISEKLSPERISRERTPQHRNTQENRERLLRDNLRKPVIEKKIRAAEHPVPRNTTAKHQAVYSLADMGYPVEEIAKRLAIGKGEVELILQLKYKGEKANGI